MKSEQFKRWFNRSFWRVSKDQRLPIGIPETPKEKAALSITGRACMSYKR